MLIEVSTDEIVDKYTILTIKAFKVIDGEKREHIAQEQRYLEGVLRELLPTIERQMLELQEVNLTLWNIEDQIRIKKAKQEFDSEFIELASTVYFTNDKRYEIKRRINEISHSQFVEEKQYVDYQHGQGRSQTPVGRRGGQTHSHG